MLRKYQNELLVLLALLLLTAAIIFKSYGYRIFQVEYKSAEEMISKIEDIARLKKLWYKNQMIIPQLTKLKNMVANSKAKIKEFKIEKKKAYIVLENLNGNMLNKIVGKYLASTPIQITEMLIIRQNEYYRLEVQCKW